MKLNRTTFGTDDGIPVLLVHGLFGQGRNLGAIARRLSARRRVITVDQRNHGDSPHSSQHSYDDMAGDLAEIIAEFGGKVDLVGHSMGGKAAMLLALRSPELLRKLVVMDIAPIAYDHDQNRYIDAMQALDLNELSQRSKADQRLAAAIPDAGVRAFLLQSLDLKASPPAWRLNLPALREAMPDIVGWPGDLPQGSFAGPALFLAGATSDYVSADGEAAMRASFPQARLVRIKNAGHWLHADAPEATAETLAAFLAQG